MTPNLTSQGLKMSSTVSALLKFVATSVLIVAWGAPAHAALSVGNVTTLTTGGSSFTHNNNGNLLILIGMRATHPAGNVTSATYGGIALTAIPACGIQQNRGASIVAFYLKNPPSGNNTLTTAGGADAPLIRAAVSVIDADVDGAPLGTCATAAGNGRNASVTVASASGEIVLGATAKRHNAETVVVGAGETERWNVKSLLTPADEQTTAVGSTKAGAPSVTISHRWTGSVRRWASLAMPIKPVPPPPGNRFFFAPAGSGTLCTESLPCALSQLPGKAAPGVELILRNGTYSGSGTVLLLDSSLNTVNGTSSNPIIVRAQNPGQALIRGDGLQGHVVRLRVDWWVIEDLRIENVNNSNYIGSEAEVLRCVLCNRVVIRRNIIRNPNAWGNNSAISITGTGNLIEDNDILRFHRNGLTLFGTGTSNNIVRGNYVGQTVDRLYAGAGIPNDGFVAYDAPNNIWENNIFEQTGSPGGSTPAEGFTAWGSSNRYYGNISIGAMNNAMSLVSAASVTTGARDYVVRDQVSVGMAQNGLYLRSPINADVQGFTAHTSNAPNRGIVLNDQDGAPSRSATIRNMMLIDTTGASATAIDTLTISHSQEWGAVSSWGSGTSGRTDSPPEPPGDVDPQFGACRVFVPDGSPFKGVGFNGQDIGATVLFAYEHGVLTNEKLWDSTLSGANRGKLRFGPAVVAGVNDSSTGNVRDTVHQRLGFGNNSCNFPAGY